MVKKVLAILIAFTLFGVLTACTKDEQKNSQDGSVQLTEMTENDNVGLKYKSNEVTLSMQLDYMNKFAFYDDNLYIYGSQLMDEMNMCKIYIVDRDGAVIREMDYSETVGEKAIISMDVDSEGCLWVMENSTEYITNAAGEPVGKSSSIQIIKFDKSGKEEKSYPLDLGWHPSSLTVYNENIYICGLEKLLVLDMEGNEQFEVNLQELSKIIKTGKGIARSYPSTDGQKVSLLNQSKQEFESWLSFDINSNKIYASDSTIYLNDGNLMYAYDINTQETKTLFRWTGLGLRGDCLDYFVLSDNSFIYCTSQGIYVISGNNEAGNHKTTLTLATMDPGSIMERVLKFNNSNDNYVIEINDYSIYDTADNSSVGQLKLSTEFSAGNVPDILDLSGLPSDIFSNNVLLEDLLPFIEQDSELDISDFNPHVLKAMKTDDKLLNFIPLFSILTVVGSASNTENQFASYNDMADFAGSASVFGNSLSREELISYDCLLLGTLQIQGFQGLTKIKKTYHLRKTPPEETWGGVFAWTGWVKEEIFQKNYSKIF